MLLALPLSETLFVFLENKQDWGTIQANSKQALKSHTGMNGVGAQLCL